VLPLVKLIQVSCTLKSKGASTGLNTATAADTHTDRQTNNRLLG
jgi:hypothetical protein